MSPTPSPTAQQLFALAFQHHQAGRFGEAETLYRRVLAVQPRHAEALHLLGVVGHQVGRHDIAVECIRQSLAVAPTNPAAYSNLGEAYRAMGQTAQAIACYRQAAVVDPRYAPAPFNLGNLLREHGRFAEAIAAYERALELKPDQPATYNNLGMALAGQGRLDEAMAAYRRALQIKPDFIEVLNNLGNALNGQHQFEEAISIFRRALEIRPDVAEIHNNLGNTLQSLGHLQEATASYRRAIGFSPTFAEAHHNLGKMLHERGELDAALASHRRALELRPNYADAEIDLGNTLLAQGNRDEAIEAYRRAIAIDPNSAPAYTNLGNELRERGDLEEAFSCLQRALQLDPDSTDALNNLGLVFAIRIKLDEAIETFQRALALRPDFGAAYINLGNALRDRGRPDEAIATFRRAIECQPDFVEAQVNLGALLARQGELDEGLAIFRRVTELKPENTDAHSNLIYLLHFHPSQGSEIIAREQQRWNRQFGDSIRPIAPSYLNDRNPRRPLRIGYVSPDFRDHVVGRNLVPLFRNHDRQQFEIFCYSGVVRSDRLTGLFRENADQWRSTLGTSDEKLAETILQDGIDILVDLAQHMAGNRLTTFARRPAPVQISFAGYPATTGIEAIPYRISDRYLESEIGVRRSEFGPDLRSPNPDLRPVEQVLLLDSFWCYDPCGVDLVPNDLPALTFGRVTFGCLNTFRKLNPVVLQLWARLLREVPTAQLLILSEAGSHREQALNRLVIEGVEAERIEFVEPCRRDLYMALHHRIDIALDPFPYNGHTTSLDALWMGVPVVSLVGQSSVARAGLSQLSNLDLAEWAAFSEDDYIAIASDLARDLPRLARFRATLRQVMQSSPLTDAHRFTRNVETTYRTLWQRWCRNPEPAAP